MLPTRFFAYWGSRFAISESEFTQCEPDGCCVLERSNTQQPSGSHCANSLSDMANLLPQYAKKRVGSIYRARFGSVLAILATSLALLTLVALLPSLLALALSPLPEEAADAGRLQSEDILSLVRTQALINHVSPVLVATTTPSALVRSALRAKPASVTVQRISYSRGDKEQVVVSGRAA